jgi:hypothetical protein
MSIPALMPAEVINRPLSTQRGPSSTVSAGNCWRRSATSSQCVVTVSVCTTPLAASRKAPVQTDATVWADAACWAIQLRVVAHAKAPSTTPPGTSSKSQAGALSKPNSGRTRRPARA